MMRVNLWGGAFCEGPDPRIAGFTRSLGFDYRLAPFDLIGSMAHARMLMETGILDPGPAAMILDGLSGMLADLEEGTLSAEGEWEDVHSWLEGTLTDRIGPQAGHLHTARSRNDQTGLALRLWLRSELESAAVELTALMEALLEQAEGAEQVLLPGYTHLQRAQPMSLAHHLMAHLKSLTADAERLIRCHRLAGCSPLGAAALAGTSHPIQPARSAWLAGLESTFTNSLHAVSDRDYVAESLFFAAMTQGHLSRWAEEIVLWTAPEFGFARLADRVAKGSSIMPQKKNPEAAEIIRGRTGRTVGNLTALLTTLKGLPLSYNSDLQEDKEPLFDSMQTIRGSLEAAAVLTAGLEWDRAAMRAALEQGHLTATELADYFTRLGLPFREAHEAVGRLIQMADAESLPLAGLPLERIQSVCPSAGADVYDALDPQIALERHASAGGPAPGSVRRQIEIFRSTLSGFGTWQAERTPPPVYLAHRAGTLAAPDSPQLRPQPRDYRFEPTRAGISDPEDHPG